MRLETKYGVLEGTVEEFKELLEDKVDLSYFSGEAGCSWREEDKSGYYVVNNDNAICHIGLGSHVPKGLVLEYKSRDWYTPRNIYRDTLGNLYELDDKDLDVCNDNHMEESFKNSKRRGTLLKHNYKYKVAKEDIYFPMDGNRVLEKGTVLIEGSINSYKDSLGNTYRLSLDTIENKLKEFYMVGTGFHFERHKLNNELYKLTLPNNQF